MRMKEQQAPKQEICARKVHTGYTRKDTKEFSEWARAQLFQQRSLARGLGTTILLVVFLFTGFARGDSGAIAPQGSVALEASRVLKAGPCRLYSLTIYNSKGSAQFVQLFNSITVPANAAVPSFCPLVVPTAATVYYRFDPPLFFTVGLAISNSSTGPTKTIGSADCWFTAETQ